jgi:LEA14-like dessication related protein
VNRRAYLRNATQWVAMLAGGSALAGCALMRLREPVQVNVVGLETLPSEGMELRLALKLRVQNPNDVALDFDGISLTLDLHGTRFASGVSAERCHVPRFGEAVISVPVSVSALALARQIVKIAGKEQPQLDYVLRGQLSGLVMGGLHFESKGEIALPHGLVHS